MKKLFLITIMFLLGCGGVGGISSSERKQLEKIVLENASYKFGHPARLTPEVCKIVEVWKKDNCYKVWYNVTAEDCPPLSGKYEAYIEIVPSGDYSFKVRDR